MAFAINVGATGDTLSGTNRVELQVQESDDNATWTAVADSDLLKVVPGGQATGTFGILNSGGSVRLRISTPPPVFTARRAAKRSAMPLSGVSSITTR